jgi:hypothetical protein
MQKDAHTVWHSILGEVELTVKGPNFDVFWSKIQLIDFNEDEVIFEVPNVFIQKNFQVNYTFLDED